MSLPFGTLIFPVSEFWWFYLAFTAFALLMLALDLGVLQPDTLPRINWSA